LKGLAQAFKEIQAALKGMCVAMRSQHECKYKSLKIKNKTHFQKQAKQEI